jgi:hypothetical protein
MTTAPGTLGAQGLLDPDMDPKIITLGLGHNGFRIFCKFYFVKNHKIVHNSEPLKLMLASWQT